MSDSVENGNAKKVFASVRSEGVVVPSDTVKQPEFKSLWVTGAGDIVVSRDGGQTIITYPSATITLGEFNLGSPCWIMTATAATLIWQNW